MPGENTVHQGCFSGCFCPEGSGNLLQNLTKVSYAQLPSII